MLKLIRLSLPKLPEKDHKHQKTQRYSLFPEGSFELLTELLFVNQKIEQSVKLVPTCT
jgi:hypothetical protein